MNYKVMTAEEAAAYVNNGDIISLSFCNSISIYKIIK